MPNPLAARIKKPEEKIDYPDASPGTGSVTAVPVNKKDIPAVDV
jgi:hypothetical protein